MSNIPSTPKRSKRRPKRPPIVREVLGDPPLAEKRMKAFSEAYKLAQEFPGLTRDLMAGIRASRRDQLLQCSGGSRQ